jgi:HAD superfamily hydrolase (TIGR01549 family)
MPRYLLFDLDGTLLPMDTDAFMKLYFGGLAAYAAPDGYDPHALIDGIMEGTRAMVQNDGTRTNAEAFWDVFASKFGEAARRSEARFEGFYREKFDAAAVACPKNPEVRGVIDRLKNEGYRLILATNPLFPAIATEHRLVWAGLSPDDFELVTTYDNSHYAKPNPAYFKEILDKIGAEASDCLMIGNDCREDTAAQRIGIPVFLITDCLLHGDGFDLDSTPHGGFPELLDYLNSL